MAKAEGYWVDAAVPNVGIRRVYVPPDEREAEAAEHGLIAPRAAAAMFGRDLAWLNQEVRARRIESTEWAGRMWIHRASADRRLGEVGLQDPVDAEYARLRSLGKWGSAEELLIQSGRMARPEYEDITRSRPAPESEPARRPTAAESFLAIFSKGGRS
jgi:hypothetical protein